MSGIRASSLCDAAFGIALLCTLLGLPCAPRDAYAANADALGTTPPVDLVALRDAARAAENGEGVAKDPVRAAQLYCEGARHGDADSQFSLGWMYANARGLPRDDATAAYFFKLAAEQGHVQAQNMLRFVGEARATTPDCLRPPPQNGVDDVDFAAATPAQERVIGLVRTLAPSSSRIMTIQPSMGGAVASGSWTG